VEVRKGKEGRGRKKVGGREEKGEVGGVKTEGEERKGEEEG
jgi:hypothetical protein